MKAMLVWLLFCAISMCSAFVESYRYVLIDTLTKQNKQIYEYQYKNLFTNWQSEPLVWWQAVNACMYEGYKYLKTF